MRHRQSLTMWSVAVILVAAWAAAPVAADVGLAELHLSRNGTFTELTVPVPGRALCNHATEEAKDGKPFRVVLDLCGVVHQLHEQNFADLPPGVITRLRTSQYATTPQNVVRIVLDLARPATYKVATERNTIIISLATPDEPEFEQWSTAGSSGGRSVMQAAFEPNAQPPAPPVPAVVPVNVSAAPSPKAPSAKAVATSIPASVPEPAVKEKGETFDVVHAPYEEAPSPKWFAQGNTGSSAQRMETEPRATAEESESTPRASGPQAERERAAQTPVVAAADVPELPQQNTTEEKSQTPTVVTTFPVPAARQYDQPVGPPWFAEAPATTELAGQQPVEQQTLPQAEAPAVVIEPTPSPTTPPSPPTVTTQKEEKLPLLARLRRKFIGGAGEEKTTVDAGADSAALIRIRALAAVAERVTIQDTAVTAEAPKKRIDRAELESKIASVEPEAVSPGVAEEESEVSAEGLEGEEKGQPVEMEVTRAEVEYVAGGQRDPFAPLVEGQRSGLWTTSLPRVDALRLVGVLQDYDGAIALFEDMEGYGYILREGDPVKNGYLLSIGSDQVVFQIDEYGWVHTVIVEMREEASRSGHGYATENKE